MKDADFQERFEGLYNDYEMACNRCELISPIVEKIENLCKQYREDRFNQALNPKHSLNDTDC